VRLFERAEGLPQHIGHARERKRALVGGHAAQVPAAQVLHHDVRAAVVGAAETTKLGVIPDRVFALEFPDKDGERARAYFFLEADRGTMPVKRRNLSQTSFHRKLLAYEVTWTQAIHTSRFGFHRFRVITVTTSAARVKSLVEACSELERGHGLFLFADRSVLDKPDERTIDWATAEELGRAGYRVVDEADLLLGREELDLSKGKCAVRLAAHELSRARGGPRCMAMPLVREDA